MTRLRDVSERYRKMISLSKRLSAIAQMVTDGNRLVDVGCDHGYLPIRLIQEGRIPSAIAMDVRQGPLERAREHIVECKLTGYIEVRLSDGLEKLSYGEGDTLVIAGMGGPLMERILRAAKDVLPGFQELILQPQSDIPHFRMAVRTMGWEIVEERLIQEDGKYYPMMKAVHQPEAASADWTEEEYLFGKLLLEERSAVLKEFLLRELRIREEILEKLAVVSEADPRASARRTEVVHERAQLLHTLKRWEDF